MIKNNLKIVELLAKSVVPRKFHPLFTPLKQKLENLAHKRKLTCIWFITWMCNYRCPYCWEIENISEYRKKNNINYLDWVSGFEKLSEEFDEIVCGISGGEPFMYNNFNKLLSNLPKNIGSSHEMVRKNSLTN